MRLPVDPTEVVRGILAGDPNRLGERIVDTFLTVWDSPAGAACPGGMVRSAVSHEPSSACSANSWPPASSPPSSKRLGVRDLETARHVRRLPTLRARPRPVHPSPRTARLRQTPALVTDIAPTIQRYLTEEAQTLTPRHLFDTIAQPPLGWRR